MKWVALTSMVFFVSGFAFSTSSPKPPRPPQYVMLAFDGSKDIGFWRESRQFAKEAHVKFTYFISGVYFLSDRATQMYQGPGKRPGRSDIGFGKSTADIQLRLREVEKAIYEGHEMASHANGHFDGSGWSEADWNSEFSQFDRFLKTAWQRNSLQEPEWWGEYFDLHMVGFRAPLLGVSRGLWPSLKTHHIAYDTSRVSNVGYWPRIENGVWNFPLAQIQRAGTNKSTLSMDYNFYYSHSKGVPGPKEKWPEYEEEMFQSYLKYFKASYLGNRAPIHIGHHFSKWNGGAYWKAMKRFALEVCHLPEVKCVTYSELMEEMNKVNSQIPRLSRGQFVPQRLDSIQMFMSPELQQASSEIPKDLDDSEVKAFMEHLKNEDLHSH